jgi:Bacterial SH3 domain
MRSKVSFSRNPVGALSLAIALSLSACTTTATPPDTAANPAVNSPAASSPAAEATAPIAAPSSPVRSTPAQPAPVQTLAELNPDPTAPLPETQQALNAIATKAGKCVTVIEDSNPPSNVRSAPGVQSGNVVGKLDNYSVVEVVNHQKDWLEIQSPMHGWVSLNLTRAVCGTGFRPVLQRINALNQKALGGDRAATDLLIRYSFQSADGAGADAAYGSLGQMAQQHPDRLIAALDAQPEAGRRKLLEGLDLLSLNPEARRSFETALAQQSNTPTAKSWQSVKRK